MATGKDRAAPAFPKDQDIKIYLAPKGADDKGLVLAKNKIRK